MNAKQMREKRAALIEQMQGMVAAAKAESRNLSNEENEKFDAINNEVEELRSAAARIERAEELKKEMAASVDFYLAHCETTGKQAEKPFSGEFTFRTTPEKHRLYSTAAKLEGFSLTKWADAQLSKAAAQVLQL